MDALDEDGDDVETDEGVDEEDYAVVLFGVGVVVDLLYYLQDVLYTNIH